MTDNTPDRDDRQQNAPEWAGTGGSARPQNPEGSRDQAPSAPQQPDAPQQPGAPAAPSAPAFPGYGAPTPAAASAPVPGHGQSGTPAPRYGEYAPGYAADQTQPTVPLGQPAASVPPPPYGQQPHAGHTPPAGSGDGGSHWPPVGGSQPAGQPKERRQGRGVALPVIAGIAAGVIFGAGTGATAAYLASNTNEQASVVQESQGSTIEINDPENATATTAVAAKASPSVVTIAVAANEGAGTGSGVVFDDEGHIITNAHVVTLDGATADPQIKVTSSDGRVFDATIVGTDPLNDLAVIQVEEGANLTPAEFADSDELNVGDFAVAIGSPLGLNNTVTDGIVSAVNRSIQVASSAAPDGGDDTENDDDSPFNFDIPGAPNTTATETISLSVLQTDAAINPGNSGGALLDGEGQVIGINVAIASSGESEGSIGVGFAIPSNVAQRVATELIESGAATHGLLGASVSTIPDDVESDYAGVYIAEVVRGGAAEAAGLEEGDIVTSFNGKPVGEPSDLTAYVRELAGGADATLTYVRDGQEFEVDVTLGTLE
ncbi:S1C family serine protease [Herbiconiux sp. SYSU D00978]|uniref:S1C family serine protease n=1 Tax=Herbiconiux sp. SYSU D00978 TaxID=2812562 RepID=UPI001A96F613|nr:trypsin-like peptidase domain-containing protein [Herbiconiux sp. SYSU D00978]